LDTVDIQVLRPFIFRVCISTKGDRPFDEVANDVKMVLRSEKAAGVGFEVEPFSADRLASKRPIPDYFTLAGFSSDQSIDGLQRTLVSVVHDLAKVFVEEYPGVKVTFRVAREDGSAPEEFLERVRTAVEVVGYAGLPFEVKPVDPVNLHHNDMHRAGFRVPSRNRRVVEYTEEDENTYALRIRRLVDGKIDVIPFIDDLGLAKIYLTPSTGKLEIGAIMPLYDRLYVELPTARDSTAYFEESFGLSQEKFVEFCKAGVVFPVFNRNLGLYPEVVWRLWIENPSLPLVSPRDADFVAMRYLWKTAEHIRQFRTDTELLRALDNAMRSLLASGRFYQSKWLYDILAWVLHGAEEFEGIAFHRGRLALANLSAGGAAAHLLSATAPQKFKDKAVADTIAIDGFVASQNIATAQAFGASLSDNLVCNSAVLKAIVPLFQGAVEVRGKLQTRQLGELIKSLEIHHSSRIPVKEYLDVMDQQETARVRSLVHKLLNGVNLDVGERELRERIILLNNEVAKLDKRALRISTVDVLGDISSGAGAISGGTAYGMVLLAKLLGGTIAGELASRLSDFTLDGPAGAAIDRVRGMLNRVSPQAIRLFRLRDKLRR
jgi:hypothetical protein